MVQLKVGWKIWLLRFCVFRFYYFSGVTHETANLENVGEINQPDDVLNLLSESK